MIQAAKAAKEATALKKSILDDVLGFAGV